MAGLRANQLQQKNKRNETALDIFLYLYSGLRYKNLRQWHVPKRNQDLRYLGISRSISSI